jgi:tripartite-type tricarboxylate transporter receptor subunit TctC
MKSNVLRAMGALLVGGALAGGALAQGASNYPNKPIKMIVPYAAGGGLDAVTRTVAQAMSEVLRQTIVVDNRAGAGGTIGTEAAVRSAPDGYTLLMAGNPELVIAPVLTPGTVRYNVGKDLVPIMLVAESPNIIIAHPSVTASLPDILSGKAHVDPGVGTPGQGSPQHIALEVLSASSKQKMLNVPYKGAAPAVADVLGGQVKLGIVGAPPVVSYFKSGKLRAVAVTQGKRSPLVPDVPTVEELTGIKGLDAFSTWYGLLAPAGTPPQVVDALQKAAAAVLARPEMKSKLAAMGTDVVATPTAAFGERIRNELKRYEDVVRRFNIKAE